MIRWIPSLALVLTLGGALAADPSPPRLIVADVPYARVWAAAQEAVRDYPLERIADGGARCPFAKEVRGFTDRHREDFAVGRTFGSERLRIDKETGHLPDVGPSGRDSPGELHREIRGERGCRDCELEVALNRSHPP